MSTMTCTNNVSTLADVNSVLVVKRTFFEVVDESVGIFPNGACRRVCSDPSLFGTCEREQLRLASSGREDDVEFEMNGLSDTETTPGDIAQNGAGTADSTEPSEHESEAHEPESSASGVSVPCCYNSSTVADDASEKESTLGRLVSENARLALENKLLRDNARLTLENKLLSQGLMSKGSMAFASWWQQHCESPDAEAEPGMQLPEPGNSMQQGNTPDRSGGNQAVPVARLNRSSHPSLAKAGSRAAADKGRSVQQMAKHHAAKDEARTTIMLRNLPNNYSRAMVLAMLNDEGFALKYNFLYLPIDFKSHACLGYAFINLVSTEATAEMWNTFNGYSKWMLPSRKVCSVSWSGPHQGLTAHVERYRNSPVMHPSIPDEYKPVVFEEGVRVVFPPPTKAPRAPRVRSHREHAAA